MLARSCYITREPAPPNLDRAAGFIGDLAGLRRGSVSITAIESVTRGLLPDVLQKFWKRHPDIRVDVMTMGSQQDWKRSCRAIGSRARLRCPCAEDRAKAGVDQSAARRADAPRSRARAPSFAASARSCWRKLLLSDASLTLGQTTETAIADAGVELDLRVATNSISLMTDLRPARARRDDADAGRCRTRAVAPRVGLRAARRSAIAPRANFSVARSKAHLPGAPAAFAKMLGEAMDALKRD